MEHSSADNKASLKGREIVSSTIRTIVGPSAQVFLLTDFLREYVPHLNLKDSFKNDDSLGKRHNAIVRRLLGTLVSPSETLEPMTVTTSGSKRKHDTGQVQENLSTLVDDIIWSLVSSRSSTRKGKEGGSPNVLSRGYVTTCELLEQEVSRCPNMRAGVICKKLNSNARFCKTSRYFQMLHRIVGDDVIRVLLRSTTMFLPYSGDDNDITTTDGAIQKERYTDDEEGEEKKGNVLIVSNEKLNYVMVCGPLPKPTSGLLPACQPDETYCSESNGKTKTAPSNQKKKKRKRKRKEKQSAQNNGEEGNPPAKESPSLDDLLGPNVPINRRSLFYSEAYIPKVGFPKHHILNEATKRKDEGGEVELLEHMIPLKDKSEGSNKQSGRNNRKRWTRLKAGGGPELCRDIIQRHARCDYHRILEKCCPLSKLVRQAKQEKDEERRKKTESASKTLLPLDWSSKVSLSQVSRANTPPDAVVAFLTRVLEIVFPHSFWGSPHNFDKVLQTVDTFVKLRRYEDLPNKTIMSGIRVTDFKWLSGRDPLAVSEKIKGKGPRQPRSSHEAATKLATYVLRWFFGSFVIPLLRSIFCVTESEFDGKNVLYYRKPVWSLFRSLSMKHLLSKQYTEIKLSDVKQRLAAQQMGCSRLRLLPKATGVRPIATLCKRDASVEASPDGLPEETAKRAAEAIAGDVPEPKRRKLNQGGSQPVQSLAPIPPAQPSVDQVNWQDRFQSTNTILRDSFEALKYEHGKNPELFGAGVTGLHEFYPRFLQFVKSVKNGRKRTELPKLYFASVDVRHCYDSIDQDRLLDIVVDILSEDDYMIHRYARLQSCNNTNRLSMRKSSEVGPPASFDTLHKTQTPGKNARNRGSVFFDEAGSTLAQKDNIMSLLREHLKSHLVVTKGRYGDRYLLQTNGIPQGSVLSGFLCNFYYGNMEKHELFGEVSHEKQGADEHKHLLVRITDDFLLITTDKAMHQSFLQTMYKGKPDLGVTINTSKIVSNFEVTVDSEDGTTHVIKDSTPEWNNLFPWCGMLFNTRKCEVMIDYYRMAGGQATKSLTVSRSEDPGAQLRKLMKMFVRPRCLPVLFDPSLNSSTTVETNFFDLCVVCAIKTEECLKSSDMMKTVTKNVAFIIFSIDDVIFYALRVIRNHLTSSESPPADKSHLNTHLALSLGWKAFRAAFQKSKALHSFMVHIDEKVRSLHTGAQIPRRVLEQSQISLILDS